MDLYIANATRQNIEFHYRMLAVKRDTAYILPVMIGRQERIPFDLAQTDVDHLVKQLHDGWGAVPHDQIDRTREFVGLSYSIDKPITASRIEQSVEHNIAVLEERGKEFRKQTAVAASAVIDTAASNVGARLLEMDAVLTVEPEKGSRQKAQTETIKVVGAGERPTPRRGRKAA